MSNLPPPNLVPSLPNDPAGIKAACDQLRAEVRARRREIDDRIEVINLLQQRCRHVYPTDGYVCKTCGYDRE